MSRIEKKIDKLGRIVLPIEFRDKLGIKNNTSVFLLLNEDSISLFASDARCALCKNAIEKNQGARLCKACIEKIKKL